MLTPTASLINGLENDDFCGLNDFDFQQIFLSLALKISASMNASSSSRSSSISLEPSFRTRGGGKRTKFAVDAVNPENSL